MTIDDALKILDQASRTNVKDLQFGELTMSFYPSPNHIEMVDLKLKGPSYSEPKYTPTPAFKAENILKPPSYLDNLSPEEVLFAATPYFDELQAQKQEHQKKIDDELKKEK